MASMRSVEERTHPYLYWGPWSSSHSAHRDLSQIEGLIVRSRGINRPWKELNFDTLVSDFPKLRFVDIEYDDTVDLSALAGLKVLEVLRVHVKKLRRPMPTTPETLVQANLIWRGGMDSVLFASSLRNLDIARYPFQNLQPLQRLSRLETLQIYIASDLTSLCGIEAMRVLERLAIESARKLTLEQRPIASQSLTDIYLQNCPQISSLKTLASMPRLQTVLIGDCKRVDSLYPLRALKDLKRLEILATRIEDRRTCFISELKSVVDVNIEDRSGYDCSNAEIRAGVQNRSWRGD